MVPDWAVGIAGIVAVITVGTIVLERMKLNARLHTTEPDVTRLTQALDEVQRKLVELEERVDFAERLRAAQKETNRLPQ